MSNDRGYDNDLKPPPGAPGWVTPELLQDTIETWQPRYHERLTVTDALDILLAVSRLVDATQ